jgi:quercetin dioxygenase-like cupin family protein
MIRSGDTLYNPVTGESMTFVTTSRETGGEYVEIELRADPDAFVAAAHVHPAQTETFTVESGTLAVKVDGKTSTATAGETVTVEPGKAHKWWNGGDSELVFRCEIRPALQFEQLIETMFSLAADGKTNEKGMPNPFRLAVIAKEHLDTVVLPFPPVWAQKAALAVGAPLGRLLGYAPTYTPTDTPAPAPLNTAPAAA